MKKPIKNKVLEDIEKLIGHKGPKKPGAPLTDDLQNKTKHNRVA